MEKEVGKRPRHPDLENLSVIVCVKNDEKNIGICLSRLVQEEPGEILCVDGNSNDSTRDVIQQFQVELVLGLGKGLTEDRKLGFEKSSKPYVAFIDADHFLKPGQLSNLLAELQDGDFDVLQSSLTIPRDRFWSRAEANLLDISHNNVGVKRMVGVAPTIYRREVLERFSFDSEITSSIDDTDLFYRISTQSDYKLAVGSTLVTQNHSPALADYIKKFLWYGRGDGEFMVKYPARRRSMLFHLLLRYPVIFGARLILRGHFGASVLSALQGFTRMTAALIRISALRG